jgi:hypothetical protein
MVDIQQTTMKSSPKSDHDQDNNPLLISDDDHPDTTVAGIDMSSSVSGVVVGGNGEDECAVDGGICLKPTGSSIKC